jgi:hypothetical protein
MSKPKRKEVTRYVAGLQVNMGDRPDEVVVTPYTLIETPKQFRLKKEDSKEFRTAARLLTWAYFPKDSEHHMSKLHETPQAALLHYYRHLLQKQGNALAQLKHNTHLMVETMTKLYEVETDAKSN